MKKTKIKVENNDVVKSLQGFLGSLLKSKFVDALLVPKMLPGGDGFVQSLIKDPAMMKDTHPLSPTLAVQSAEILSQLTSSEFSGRIGAVLKPCELRASVELVKFLQVNLDHIVTISIDCPGTVEVKDYAALGGQERGAAAQALLNDIAQTPVNVGGGVKLRDACQICEYPVPLNADITIGLLGCNVSQEICVSVKEKIEQELSGKLSLQFMDDKNPERDTAVEALLRKRKEMREKQLNEMKDRVNGLDKFLNTFSTCIRCHNCMNVCPICYCKECVFKSPLFEHRVDQFLSWASRKGAIRMPTDTMIFHLTRLTHMATSCVGCGMCDSACPNGLPVSRLFNLIGKDLQEMFGYVPGRNVEEEPPVSVFKEEELKSESGT